MENTLLHPDEALAQAGIAFPVDERPADIVETLNTLPAEKAAGILDGFTAERAIEVLDLPGLDDAADIVQHLPPAKAVTLLQGLSADRLTDIFHDLDASARDSLIDRLDADTRDSLNRLLSYPEQSAGSIMTVEFVSVPGNWTVGQTLDHIRKVESTRETVYSIYVLHPVRKTLQQAVTLRRLIAGDPGAPILSVAARRTPITISPLASREEAARLISKYDLLAIPVVSRSGHVLGIVTVDDVIDEIVKSGTEDAQRFGGVEALEEPYLRTGFGEMIRKRAGWLSVLFLSEMLTASAMQYFEAELEKAIVLTLFIPLIMSSGGNSGSQATSLLIRALALGEVQLRDWWRVALRELPTGLMLGAILGVIGMCRIFLWQHLGFYDYGEHWMLIALTVGAALVGIVTFGSMAGSMLPFILQRLGFDPASASAPFVATLVDVTGLVIYFAVAAAILTGTLL
ncbi:magnesium transporter [Aestuariivirga sp.]|uniref:magnesium transporter n=1 Tax=Aestuariivirga sp. TaxID=2650926 RepID=UPI0039E34536